MTHFQTIGRLRDQTGITTISDGVLAAEVRRNHGLIGSSWSPADLGSRWRTGSVGELSADRSRWSLGEAAGPKYARLPVLYIRLES